jgi:spore coat polysaccharide biosynthesis protein SpsF
MTALPQTAPRSRRIVATIEARMGSTRLPGKVVLPLGGQPLLQRMVERVRFSACVDAVWVASTVAPADQQIDAALAGSDCPIHHGPIEDITTRLLEVAEAARADVLVQLTGDCPLVDFELIDLCVRHMIVSDSEYCVLGFGNDLPIGLDVRAVTVDALRRSAAASVDPVDRVHGTYFIHRSPDAFRHARVAVPAVLQRPEFRLTVDEPADYALVSRVFDVLYPRNPQFRAADIIDLLDRNPDWAAINRDVRQKTAEEG